MGNNDEREHTKKKKKVNENDGLSKRFMLFYPNGFTGNTATFVDNKKLIKKVDSCSYGCGGDERNCSLQKPPES